MLTTVTFQQEGNDWITEPVTATSDALVFRAKVDKPGSIILERSITGADFIPSIALPPSLIPGDTLTVEYNLEGTVPQQQLRFRFQGCTPVSVSVLQ